MDTFSVLNYQGSKKNLLEFIHHNIDEYIKDDDVILDIFAGTSSVAYSYKSRNRVFANDAEPYAATIAKALLGNPYNIIKLDLLEQRIKNYKMPIAEYTEWIRLESQYISEENLAELIALYKSIPTVWSDGKKFFKTKDEYSLFVKYYSTSYFGIKQAQEIDAIKHAIDASDTESRDILHTALFYAMKECVFSKDGHMAQPLDPEKNASRLFKQRKKSIYSYFISKCKEFAGKDFIKPSYNNKVFNSNFEELLASDTLNEVSVIYADPPYTDMQYSRYYHLLNTVLEYNYPNITQNKGEHTKGLYLENRFQSQLSKKNTCLDSMKKLVEYSKSNNILLAISFAYPQDIINQKTDRYVMNIEDLINLCKKIYSEQKVRVEKNEYTHSNNRNSETKKVLEYLIICERA